MQDNNPDFPFDRHKTDERLAHAYVRGTLPPNHPVPAIPIKVGYHPYSLMPDRAPYIYVHLWQRVLWTFFKGWGLVIERNE